MKLKESVKDVLLAVAAMTISLIIYRTVGKLFTEKIESDIVSGFVGELFLAVPALLSAILLKKTDIFKTDSSKLKSGWPSAGVFYVIIAFFGFLSLGSLLQPEVPFYEVLLFFGFMFLVGFAEEILFRGLIQNAFHKYFKEDSLLHVCIAILCTGLVFGLTHLTNALRQDVSFSAALIQSIVNIANGMYLGAIYFRTGKNLWFLIAIHAFYDGAGMIANGILSNSATTSSILNNSDRGGWMTVAVWLTVYLAAFAFVMRPKKTDPLLKKEIEN